MAKTTAYRRAPVEKTFTPLPSPPNFARPLYPSLQFESIDAKTMTEDDELLERLQHGWHWIPGWVDQQDGLAGRGVLFQRKVQLPQPARDSAIHISADTRYKLLIDEERVCVGPARGSPRQWFYDTVTLPNLEAGTHLIEVVVQRFFFSCPGATTFARTASPGLTIVGTLGGEDLALSCDAWRARELTEIRLPYRLPFDLFLHVRDLLASIGRMKCSRMTRFRTLKKSLLQRPIRNLGYDPNATSSSGTLVSRRHGLFSVA